MTTTTILSLPQLIDLALGVPEVGIVNFNLLQYCLHVIVKNLSMEEVNIEFRGEDGEKVKKLIQVTPDPRTPAFQNTNYTVQGGKGGKGKGKIDQDEIKRRILDEERKEREIKIIEQRKNSKEDPVVNPSPLHSLKDDGQGFSTVVVVQTQAGSVQTPAFSLALDKSHIDRMAEDISDLQKSISELRDLPNATGLIEAVRKKDTGVVQDMYCMLTLTKRVDAAETAMSELAAMIEELAKEGALGEMSRPSTPKKKAPSEKDSRTPSKVPSVVMEQAQELRRSLDGGMHQSTIDRLNTLETRINALEGGGSARPSSARGGGDLEKLEAEVATIKSMLVSANIGVSLTGEDGAEGPTGMEKKLNEIINSITNLKTTVNNQISSMNTLIGNLERDLTKVKDRQTLTGGAEATLQGGNIAELYSKFMKMEEEVTNLNESLGRMVEEKQESENLMNSMIENIECLKSIKANKEEVEEALADKVNMCMINRKVSHSQFDATCDDLSKGIEEALLKLAEQEEMWQQALNELQRDMGAKLDKMDLAPLRDFVNSKLTILHEKVKALSSLKREQEAAGTKCKLLNNVKCISCDKEVVMRKKMDPTLVPPANSMPVTKSMGPYLAYELDQLRKQQKGFAGGRNLNHFESAVIQVDGKVREAFCNRYCGGSHTTTTPQQRVTRMGHFLEQWGPELSGTKDSTIKGTDGQVYKGLDMSKQQKCGSQLRPPQVAMVVQGDIVTNRPEPEKSDAESEARKSTERTSKPEGTASSEG